MRSRLTLWVLVGLCCASPGTEIAPSCRTSLSGGTFHCFATAATNLCLAWYAARRIVGALEGVVVEPPESGP